MAKGCCPYLPALTIKQPARDGSEIVAEKETERTLKIILNSVMNLSGSQRRNRAIFDKNRNFKIKLQSGYIH